MAGGATYRSFSLVPGVERREEGSKRSGFAICHSLNTLIFTVTGREGGGGGSEDEGEWPDGCQRSSSTMEPGQNVRLFSI